MLEDKMKQTVIINKPADLCDALLLFAYIITILTD